MYYCYDMVNYIISGYLHTHFKTEYLKIFYSREKLTPPEVYVIFRIT